MAYTLLERLRWSMLVPAIYVNIYYDLQRSGSSMQYKIKLDIELLTGTAYFGYPIYQKISLDGAQKDSATLKNAYPSEWSSSIIYESGWLTVSNKTSGNTALSVELYSGLGSTRSGTYSYSLPVSPAASVLGSVSVFNIGSSIPISITKYNSSFTDNLVINYGGTTVKTVSGITNGASVSFSSAELNMIYGLMSTVKSGVFTFVLQTYNGGTLLGSSTQTATGSISDANPTLSAAVVDINATTIALTGNSAKLVKYKSTARVTITASGNKGATIAAKVVNGVSVPGTTLDIANISVTPLTVTVTDSRGNSTTVTINPTVVAYVPLTVSANFYRPAPTTGEVAVRFSGNYFNGSFGAVANTLTLSWAYRLKGASSWTAGGTFSAGTDYSLSGNTFTSGTVSLGSEFNYQNNYEFILYFTDQLVSANTGALFVSKGVPVFDWGENGFDFHVPIKIDGDIKMSLALPEAAGKNFLARNADGKIGDSGKKATDFVPKLTELSANANFNDYMTEGTYYFGSGYTLTNCPDGVNGWLTVYPRDNASAIKQLWFRQGTANSNDWKSWVRTLTGGIWSSWAQLYTSKDVIPILNGGTGATTAAEAFDSINQYKRTQATGTSSNRYTKIADLTAVQYAVSEGLLYLQDVGTADTFGILRVGMYGTGSTFNSNGFYWLARKNLQAYVVMTGATTAALYIKMEKAYQRAYYGFLGRSNNIALVNEQPLLSALPASANYTAEEYLASTIQPIANGGTGATTAAGARTNLGIQTWSGSVTIAAGAYYVDVTVSGAATTKMVWVNHNDAIGNSDPIIVSARITAANTVRVYRNATIASSRAYPIQLLIVG